jgi:hypothetical protein
MAAVAGSGWSGWVLVALDFAAVGHSHWTTMEGRVGSILLQGVERCQVGKNLDTGSPRLRCLATPASKLKPRMPPRVPQDGRPIPHAINGPIASLIKKDLMTSRPEETTIGLPWLCMARRLCPYQIPLVITDWSRLEIIPSFVYRSVIVLNRQDCCTVVLHCTHDARLVKSHARPHRRQWQVLPVKKPTKQGSVGDQPFIRACSLPTQPPLNAFHPLRPFRHWKNFDHCYRVQGVARHMSDSVRTHRSTLSYPVPHHGYPFGLY